MSQKPLPLGEVSPKVTERARTLTELSAKQTERLYKGEAFPRTAAVTERFILNY